MVIQCAGRQKRRFGNRNLTSVEVDQELADTNEVIKLVTGELSGLFKSIGVALSLLLVPLFMQNSITSSLVTNNRVYFAVCSLCGIMTVVFHALQAFSTWQQQRALQRLYHATQEQKNVLSLHAVIDVERRGWGCARSWFFFAKAATSVLGSAVLIFIIGRAIIP